MNEKEGLSVLRHENVSFHLKFVIPVATSNSRLVSLALKQNYTSSLKSCNSDDVFGVQLSVSSVIIC